MPPTSWTSVAGKMRESKLRIRRVVLGLSAVNWRELPIG